MSDRLKWMKTLLDKILFPLLVIAIVGLFGAYARLQAVETKAQTLEEKLDEFGKDLKVLRCLSGDRITCKVIGMDKDDG